MTIEEKIKTAALSLGLDECGITSENGKSIVVCLFPYYVDYPKGNISRYAAVVDYHIIAKKYLNKLAEICKFDDFEIYADISPYNEKELAQKAGLGVKGQNSLLINKKYGSYVFIGLIVLNSLRLKDDSPTEGNCLSCGSCARECPGGAITKLGFIPENCLSDITQRKGKLSEIEAELIKKQGTVWGCDKCSDVCPMNKNVKETPLPEFKENIISSLFLKDIAGISNKEFLAKYHDRAFTWRGKNVLLRNCELTEDCLPVDKL